MQIDQLRRRLDLSVLMLVIEPTGPDGNVALGRHPVRARPIAAIQARHIRVSRREIPAVRRGPARLAGDPVLVPDPANIRAGVAEEHGSGLQRSEEHTSELQSQSNLVCRLLLEKKKIKSSEAGKCSMKRT